VIKSESDYYPWGGELQFTNADSNRYKFTGKERDTETQLDYFGARYYSNGLGRFITPDWAAKPAAVPYGEFADPQSLNLYTYVRNVPTTQYDMDGHCDGFLDCAASFGQAVLMGMHNFFTPANRLSEAIHASGAGGCGSGAQCAETGQGAASNPLTTNFTPHDKVEAVGIAIGENLPAALTMVPEMAAATEVVDLTAMQTMPSMIGFSENESSMLNNSLNALSGAGYDLSPLQQLVKVDMPPGCCAMSLSTPPTGAALGDAAFTSQEMLNHTLEEELLHLGQDLPHQTFGPGTAAENEAAVDAARKFPEPPK
jgi:RHS repeat-associated protein